MSAAGEETTSLATESRQERFAHALADGQTVERAGALIGLGRTASYEWAGNPHVVELTRHFRSQVRSQVVDLLARSCTMATATLLEVMRSSDSDHARVRAADAVLTHAANWIELGELSEQVAELEEQFSRSQKGAATSARDRARLELLVGEREADG